jgi:large subunit ribosomal protein L17
MRHKVAGRKLGRTSSHREAMLRNLVSSLFEHGRVFTTLPKAKEARKLAERCITIAGKAVAAEDQIKSLHYRRELLKKLHHKSVVKHLIDEVAPKYVDRPGGYTRVLKAGYRKGDNGTIALFELV